MNPSDLLEGLEVVDSYIVRVPTYVHVSKAQTKAVNLNIYRNLHHHHLNTQKKNFHDEVKPLLRGKPRAEKVWIHYQIFAPRRGTVDTMNVGSIVDKYFSDTLVEAGKIPDDSKDHVVLATFSFGGLARMDGHAIATVNILKEENENMRVMLDQDDIAKALDAYVKTLNLPGATGVDLTVTDDGEIEAEVLMGEVKPKNKGGRPRGSKNRTTSTTKPKPKESDPDDVEAAAEGDSDDADRGSSSGAEGDASEAEEGDDKDISSNNPSIEEDDQSSESAETDGETEEAADTPAEEAVKPKKKSSIFDVD